MITGEDVENLHSYRVPRGGQLGYNEHKKLKAKENQTHGDNGGIGALNEQDHR